MPVINSRIYKKSPLNFEDLLSKLINRGLEVSDHSKALHYLEHISYFRLTGYGLAFEQYNENKDRIHQFIEGTDFNDLLRAYVIDRKIRILIIDAIERIEVAVRSTINHEMSCKHKNSHWYLDEALFFDSDQFKHKDFIKEVRRSTACNAHPESDKQLRREQFINHYYHNYDEPVLPPCWMVAEVLSLGSWSKVYSHLDGSKDRKIISRRFDLSPHTLDSWLHALTYLRNLCAHHSRLYYRPLVIIPKQDKNIPFDHINRLSNLIAVIYWFIKHISPGSGWIGRVNEVLNELPKAELIHYGFKESWLDEPFWK